MSFSTPITGHKPQLSSLREDIDRGNVAHAYLFTGPKHVGKFTVARWFAEELIARGVDDNDNERTRQQVQKLIHPDILVLDKLWMEDISEDWDLIAQFSNVPQEHRKKAKSKTDTIGIDDIRALQERMHEVGQGQYKCCLVRSMERMQDEAVNALLKILEEPPDGSVFILTTESLSSLLATLVSRVRVTRFSRVSQDDMQLLLKGVPADDQRFILDLAQGAPGVAVRLRNDPDALRIERQVHGQASSVWHGTSLHERLKILSPLLQRNPEGEKLLFHLALTLRDDLSSLPSAHARSFQDLVRGLETNASRPLLVQKFAMSI
jgi:DNA polymerase-3 subunit delta'